MAVGAWFLEQHRQEQLPQWLQVGRLRLHIRRAPDESRCMSTLAKRRGKGREEGPVPWPAFRRGCAALVSHPAPAPRVRWARDPAPRARPTSPTPPVLVI